MKILTSKDVENCITNLDAVEVMRQLFTSDSMEEKHFSRKIMDIRGTGGLTLFMPAYEPIAQLLGIKISSIRPKNKKLPIINGLYVLLNYETGQPKALIESNCITALRTAAVSALVTNSVVPSIAHTLVVIGAGEQAFAHISTLCCTQKIEKIVIFLRDHKKFDSFLGRIKSLQGVPEAIYLADSVDNAVKQATILCTCTSTESTIPLIPMKSLKQDIHINAIGGSTTKACELDPMLYQQSFVIVEAIKEACNESGEIKEALSKKFISASHLNTIQNILSGKIDRKKKNITIYRSVGLAIEDLMLAEYIYQRSLDRNYGTYFSNFTAQQSEG